MNNNFKKKLATVCVATLAFFGIQASMVMAMENESLEPIEDKVAETNLFIDKMEENPVKPMNQDILKENIARISISDEEKDLFARLVNAEAKGESKEGKVAVATVVLNRVDSPQFPNTITEVIYEVVGDAYAFSPVQNGEINKPATKESMEAVDEALRSKDRLNHAVYFYNQEIATDDWIRSREIVKTIGNHVFAV